MTLRTRLTAAFVLVLLVPLLLGVALVTTVLPSARSSAQDAGVTSEARLVAAVVQGLCDRARVSAEATAQTLSAGDPAAARAAAEVLVRDGLVDGVVVTDAAGGPVVAVGAALPVGPGDCAQGRLAWDAQAAYALAQVPLERPAGTAAGTVAAAVALDDRVARRLADAVGEGAVVLVNGESGGVLARSGPVPGTLVAAALAADGTVHSDGRAARAVPHRPGQPVTVVLVQEQAPGWPVLPVAAGVLLVGVVLAAGLAQLLARAATRPLHELSDAAARVAAGDLTTSIEVRSRDELGRLGDAFNAMTEDLRGYVGELEASRDELQAGLARLGETLSGTHDLERILGVVLDTAMAAVRAGAGAVLLVADDGRALRLAVGRGLTGPRPADGAVPLAEGVSGSVAATGDAVAGPVGAGGLPADPWQPQATSVIAVPLLSSNRFVGVLALYDTRGGGALDDRDLATIRTFAGQATVAVDNVLLHEEAQRLSVTDGLTGLANYRAYAATVEREVERAARFGRPLSLLLLDLDHFKAVNDTHGHQRGDAVLVEIAGRVRAQVRDIDTVARYGGEEIVLVLPETDEAGAAQAAERICDAVRRRPFGMPGEVPVALTVSVGVAVFPLHGASAVALLRAADAALYAAKHGGRDTWRLADPAPARSDGAASGAGAPGPG